MDKQLIEDIESGKKRVISEWTYLINFWTPIITILTFLIMGVLWFANANSRLFTDEKIKYETEQNTIAARQRTFDKLDERYVRHDEMDEFQQEVKELAKEIKNLRIALKK